MSYTALIHKKSGHFTSVLMNVLHKLFLPTKVLHKVFLSPWSNMLTNRTSLRPRRRLNLLAMPLSYPVMILSPATNWPVTDRWFLSMTWLSQSFCCFCPNLFETCCWCEIQRNGIFAKINYFDEVKHWLYSMYYLWAVFKLRICPKGLASVPTDGIKIVPIVFIV